MSSDVLPFPARELVEVTESDVDLERLRALGRCAFGIRYPGDTEAMACDLRDRGLYCATHNPHGSRAGREMGNA